MNKKNSWLAAAMLGMTALLAGCGGFNEHMARSHGPELDPARWLSGKMTGRQIITDRNDNIVQTARIMRECKPTDQTRGECVDTIEYYYNNREGKKPATTTNRMSWTIDYSRDSRVVIKDNFGKLQGRVLGSVLLLEGNKRLPGEEKKSSSLEARHQLLPGPGEPLLETENYRILGITIGTTRTYWVKEDMSHKLANN